MGYSTQCVQFFVINTVIFSVTTNLLRNPSFETSDFWTLSIRKSMWEVTPADESDALYTDDFAKDGVRSLLFRSSPHRSVPKTVYASQHVVVSNSDIDIQNRGGPLELSFWYAGKISHPIKVTLDVIYEDESNIHVETNPDNPMVNSDFIKHCIIIPGYGNIISFMVHIFVENIGEDTVYLDNVYIDFISYSQALWQDYCQVYLNSFPPVRKQIPFFLKPTVTFNLSSITLVTQLTLDRVDHLQQTAKIWKGPISAALFVTDVHDIKVAVSTFSKRYVTTEALRDYVTIHLVFEDQLNRQDSSLYPVNMLRNVALKHAHTKYVFYVDADITPAFNSSTAELLRSKAVESQSTQCQKEKCAFIVPIFHSRTSSVEILTNKTALLENIQGRNPSFEPFLTVSHGVVRYKQWYAASDPYMVSYRDDMEPYFIVDREAPLMSEMFVGYGRDKCAYSKEIHWAGYKFAVLPELFMINRREFPGSKTIYERSGGVQLRVFFNIAFHNAQLETKYKKKEPGEIKKNVKATTTCNSERHNCDKNSHTCVGDECEKYKSNNVNIHTGNGEHIQDCKMDSATVASYITNKPTPENWRKDVFVEGIFKDYNVVVYIEITARIDGSIITALPYAHPDAIINIIPGHGDMSVQRNGVFTTIRHGGVNTTMLLQTGRELHPSPCVIWVDTAEKAVQDVTTSLSSALSVVSESDVIIINGDGIDVESIHALMCAVKSTWHVIQRDHTLLLKSAAFNSPNEEILPGIPKFVSLSEQYLSCGEDMIKTIKADIVVFTKDRPMQLYAFLESLSKMVTGVNTVWVIQFKNERFQVGYQSVYDAFSSAFYIQRVLQEKGTFGSTVLRVLEDMTAGYLVLAVDELVWLREVDLRHASCLLKKGGDDTVTFQLRLGTNIGTYDKIKSARRFYPITSDPHAFLFYPRGLPYDFGYVLNIDATLISKQSLVSDWTNWIERVQQPNQLEGRWIWSNLHTRCRQWHLMYSSSSVVNNDLTDGRVTDRDVPSDKSLQLLSRLMEERMTINIDEFIKRNRSPRTTHIQVPVTYKKVVET